MKTLFFALCLFPAFSHAQEVKLDWVGKGFFQITHYHQPKRVDLSEVKPEHLTELPEGLVEPRFSSIEMGPKDARMKVIIVIEQRGVKEARMWLDANGDGDLTNDALVKWQPMIQKSDAGEVVHWRGEAQVLLKYGDAVLPAGLVFYRNGIAVGTSSRPGSLMYHRDYGRSGVIQVGDRTVKAYLSDDSTTGDFTAGRSGLGLDLNGDNKIDLRTEKLPVTSPFNIGGTTYEVSGLTADGGRFELVQSDKKVPEVKMAQPFTPEMKELQKGAAAVKVTQGGGSDFSVGTAPVSFEAKTLEGKAVRFPQDYKGRLVMIDFWATWCGPCIAELPGLIKVYNEFHDRGFDVLGISLDSKEDVASLPDFIQGKGMKWPQICDGQGWECTISRRFGVRGIPSCWLVDGDTGLIVATSRELRGSALRGTVESALASLGKAPTPGMSRVIPKTAAPNSPAPSDPVVMRVRSLAAEGRLTPAEKILAQLKVPQAARVELPHASTTPLRGREIAKLAAAAHLRVGWIYQCTKCDRWHSNLAGGYAIAPDLVMTARHVVEPPASMREGSGHAVVVRGSDEVLAVTSVLMADETGDSALLRVSAQDLKPLAFSRDVQAGDTSYCLSDPSGVVGHFSTGIVNRVFSLAKAGEKADPRQERIAVSADWAPGSSGSAILDECGNIIGHVARIRPLFGKPDAQGKDTSSRPTLMTVNEAIPAFVILPLIQRADVKS